MALNLTAGAGTAQDKEGQTVGTFLGSLGSGAGMFALQFGVFYLLKNKFTRIYRPKTYLVPEKDRTRAPPTGLFKWVIPVFTTPNAELISKCGLDAYFFLRYLRMLLKIFIPSAILILLILLPINSRANIPGVQGMDKLGWTNYDPSHTNRFWAHLLLAIAFLFWMFFVIYHELRGYIRVRQAYLTSPQHRLRASATTVLIRSVPRKWLTEEALIGLFDVFPGGLRSIWINRDFQELNDKVKLRDQLALKLEAAETALIRDSKKKYTEMQQKRNKEMGKQEKKLSKAEMKQQNANDDAAAYARADQAGVSAGNPHQAHTVDEALQENSSSESDQPDDGHDRSKFPIPIPVLGQGYDAVRGGIGAVGQLGRKFFDDVRGAPQKLNEGVDHACRGAGFSLDGPRDESIDQDEVQRGRITSSEFATSNTNELEPSPWQSPQVAEASTTPESQQGLHAPSFANNGISHQDYALPQASAPKTLSSPSDPSSAVKSPDTARTANDLYARNSTHDGTSGKSKRQPPPGKLDWTSNNFLQPNPKRAWWQWKGGHDIELPSPEPNQGASMELGAEMTTARSLHGSIGTEPTLVKKTMGFFKKKGRDYDDAASFREAYPEAYDKQYMDDRGMDTEPEWTKYLKPGDRNNMRLPLFGLSWMPFMPSWTFIGHKVDTIHYCRKEVARLNVEIETDQKEPEKFPLMNSAFIQFNHQVAAHMACQSVSHHFPNTMAPRLVEIAPGDVIWDNMSIGYKQRLVRMFFVVAVICGMIVLWAVPVSVTAAFANLRNVEATWPAFAWLERLPGWLVSLLQGILPPTLLLILLAILPVLLRLLAGFQGVPTGMTVELDVQGFYFAFLFVQIFLIVTISSSIFDVFQEVSDNPREVAYILARNIPRAANYFFSYLILQALSVSSGALAQIPQLATWFLLRPILDNTARQKFNRQLNLQNVQWGTFFPVYTNLACIGVIYSVISPVVMIFNIITFGLFWVTYRYQTLYVNKYRFDTGGLLFPKAINQLFTGIYVMQLALIGLFLLVSDAQGRTGRACLPQAIIMIIMLILTAVFHVLINMNFSPLFRYMPITLEDDAVARDEEFERMQAKRWAMEEGEEIEAETSQGPQDIEDRLEHQEEIEQNQEKNAEAIEMEEIKNRRFNPLRYKDTTNRIGTMLKSGSKMGSWADKARSRTALLDSGRSNPGTPNIGERRRQHQHHDHSRRASTLHFAAAAQDAEGGGVPGNPVRANMKIDHTTAIGDALFGSYSDEIEDLTTEERDRLVRRAFQHEAIRAKRPVIWLPRDDLGVSDDEIRRMQAFSSGNIWASNEGTGLDRKGRVLFRRAPPDFSEMDLIEL